MPYDDLATVIFIWLFCLVYIWYTFEDFKNWREQDMYMKLVMFHMSIGFLLFSFILILFILKTVGFWGGW